MIYHDQRTGKKWEYVEFLSIYWPGDLVSIDGGDVHAIVIGHLWRDSVSLLEVQWLANGSMQSMFLNEWRLTMIKRHAER